MKQYMGTREAAEMFGKHQDTIRKWIECKIFNNVLKVMGGYLIPVKEVERVRKETEDEGK